MLCCGIGAASLASVVLARKQAQAASSRRPTARIALAAAALSAFLAGSALVSVHLGHYMDRAQANEHTLLAEFLAQPICTGARPR